MYELSLRRGQKVRFHAYPLLHGIAAPVDGPILWVLDNPSLASFWMTDGGKACILTAGTTVGDTTLTASAMGSSGVISSQVLIHIT